MEIREVASTRFASVSELAAAFGADVFEPEWWPEDIGELAYELVSSGAGPSYHIGSVRADGRPIVVIGQHENPRSHLPPEDWCQPVELEALGATVAATGAGYRAVVHRERQRVQLIGYLSEAEVIRAVLSLKPAGRAH